jgi:hypothetical protein
VAELREVANDLYEFLKALVRKWRFGLTGGILAVVLLLTGVFNPLPKHVVAAAVIGYVLVAAFFAWQEQYHAAAQLDTPLQKRKKLDSLACQGEYLLSVFKMGKSPLFGMARAKRWEKAVLNFVSQNFTLTQYDNFKWCTPGTEIALSIHFDAQDKKLETVALEIAGRLEGLRAMRESLRD